MTQLYVIGFILFISFILIVKEILEIYLTIKRKRVLTIRHLQEHILILIAFISFIVTQHAIIYLSLDSGLLVWIVEERGVANVLVTVYLLFLSFTCFFIKHLKKERKQGEKGFVDRITITKTKEFL